MRRLATSPIAPSRRVSLLAAVVAVLLPACSEVTPSPPSDDEDRPTAPTGLVVSEARPAPAGAASPAGLAAGSTGKTAVAFVSLAPGTLPQGVSISIQNVTTGVASVGPLPLSNGGLDPVAVPASAGDSLEIVVLEQGGTVSHIFVIVPIRRPPVVVRTNPPPGRTDVALSAVLQVVFSEPVDPATLAGGVRLETGGTTVTTSVSLLPDQPWMAELVPAEILEPETSYDLQATTAVRDLDGDALKDPVAATFTTESSSVTVQAVLGWDPVTFEFSSYYSYRWWTGPDANSGDCPMYQCPARRLTISRISEPAEVVWDIVDTTGTGFEGIISGNMVLGAVATVDLERVGPTADTVMYSVSVTLLDGRVGSAVFNSYHSSVDSRGGAELAVATIPWISSQLEYSSYIYRWWDGPGGYTNEAARPARRLTVARLSDPAGIVWDIVDISGSGFAAAWHGNVWSGVRAAVEADPFLPPTQVSVLYRVSVTLMDGREASTEFDTYRPPCWWQARTWDQC